MAMTTLEWAGAAAFRAAPLAPHPYGGSWKSSVSAAAEDSADGGGGVLTWVQVQGAGHMVPMDNGAAAHFALDSLL